MAIDGIKVSVKGVGLLRKYINPGVLELPTGSTLSLLTTYLDIPDTCRIVCVMGGFRRTPETVLENGDSVILFSPLPGG